MTEGIKVRRWPGVGILMEAYAAIPVRETPDGPVIADPPEEIPAGPDGSELRVKSDSPGAVRFTANLTNAAELFRRLAIAGGGVVAGKRAGDVSRIPTNSLMTIVERIARRNSALAGRLLGPLAGPKEISLANGTTVTARYPDEDYFRDQYFRHVELFYRLPAGAKLSPKEFMDIWMEALERHTGDRDLPLRYASELTGPDPARIWAKFVSLGLTMSQVEAHGGGVISHHPLLGFLRDPKVKIDYYSGDKYRRVSKPAQPELLHGISAVELAAWTVWGWGKWGVELSFQNERGARILWLKGRAVTQETEGGSESMTWETKFNDRAVLWPGNAEVLDLVKSIFLSDERRHTIGKIERSLPLGSYLPPPRPPYGVFSPMVIFGAGAMIAPLLAGLPAV